jgi:hypothetical protein
MINNAVDLIQLAKELPKRQRGRACIILTRDYPEQETWATKLAGLAGMHHVNLLNELAETGQGCKMSSFTVDGLFKYLAAKDNSAVLVVSGIEFIKATWAYNPRAMDQFAHQVELWSKKPALLFVMQYDPLLAAMQFTRFPNLQFVVDQQNTIAL